MNIEVFKSQLKFPCCIHREWTGNNCQYYVALSLHKNKWLKLLIGDFKRILLAKLSVDAEDQITHMSLFCNNIPGYKIEKHIQNLKRFQGHFPIHQSDIAYTKFKTLV